jgi:hypothetical protein
MELAQVREICGATSFHFIHEVVDGTLKGLVELPAEADAGDPEKPGLKARKKRFPGGPVQSRGNREIQPPNAST